VMVTGEVERQVVDPLFVRFYKLLERHPGGRGCRRGHRLHIRVQEKARRMLHGQGRLLEARVPIPFTPL